MPIDSKLSLRIELGIVADGGSNGFDRVLIACAPDGAARPGGAVDLKGDCISHVLILDSIIKNIRGGDLFSVDLRDDVVNLQIVLRFEEMAVT